MFKSKKKRLGCLAIFLFLGGLFIIGWIAGYVNWKQNQSTCSGGGGTALNVSGNTTSGNTKQIAKACWDTFKKAGFSDAAAAGAVGNLQGESGLNIKQNEYGGSGYGLAQFTGTTLNQARAIAAQQHYNFDSAEGQTAVIVYQCEHGGWIPTHGAESYDAFKKQNDVSKATFDFLWGYERPSIPRFKVRLQDAQQWMAAFGKGNDKTTATAQDFAAANSDGAKPDSNGDCNVSISTGGGGDVLKTAESMKGWFHYGEVHPSPTLGKDLKKPNRNGITDCSGFVWLVLYKCGYKVPPNMGWFTGSMAADANGPHHWLKAIPANQAKAGDIVIVNDGSGAGGSGHTAILMQDWHGNNTMIINEGGCGGSGGVNESTFEQAFLSLLPGNRTFAEPVK